MSPVLFSLCNLTRKIINNPSSHLAGQPFFTIALSPIVVRRAIKVAVIVGTILAFINHGEKILSMSLSSQGWFKVTLTYLVPYCVSTWSAVGAIKANATNTR
ncbi:MAG: nitrate/nitrite transporter NrtS [Gammaproteobacteria bacterium]